MTKFVNREPELEVLGRLRRKRGAQFLVVYGRRRIGKTALLARWTAKAPQGPHLMWTAYRTSPQLLLESFSERFRARLAPERAKFVFANWEAALLELFAVARSRRLIAVVDEFPYLAECVPETSTLLQRIWDEQSSGSRLVLTLCGSHYHMMTKQLLSPKAPLYGRSTASLQLDEIEPNALGLFLPRYSPEQIVRTYSVIGGVPKYLDLWDDRWPVFRNVRELILSPATLFRHEALFLIQDEIAEPRTYLAILEALGAGMRSPTTIARLTGVRINHMGKYLATLLDLRLVRRVVSQDAPDRSNSRLSRYEIRDPFLRFHFEFLQRHIDLLDQGRSERLEAVIRDRFEAHVGKTAYEELARRLIIRLGDDEQLPFVPAHVGRAWTRAAEIDVVAVGDRDRALLVGECQWRSTKMGPAAIDDLRARVGKFKRFAGTKVHLALFSKSGFTKPLLARAAREGVMLFEGADFRDVPLED